MPTRFAIASGNWSNTAIWDNGAVPLAADDVYANSFTVTLDTNATVNTLRNDTSGANNSTGNPNVLVPNLATPVMTSNNTPSGSVTASSGANPYLAFDQATSTGNWATVALNTGWLAYQFASSRTIRRYAFIGADVNRLPRTWTFEGSNDGVTWAVLDTQTNVTLVANTWYSYPIASPAAYTWYRINVTATFAVSNPVGIAELQMTESSGVVLGNGANGGYVLNNGVTITATTGLIQSGTATLITYTGATSASITATNVTLNATSTTGYAVSHSGTGTLTYTGNVGTLPAASTISGVQYFRLNGGGTLNIIGNLTGVTRANNQGRDIVLIQTVSNGIINVTGNVVGGTNTGAFSGTGSIFVCSAACTINITGNVTGGVQGGQTNNVGVINATVAPTVVINGNVTGGSSNPGINTDVGITLTVNGNVTASSSAAGISSTSAGATIVVNGNLFNDINGTMAVNSSRLQISPAANQTWYMTTSGGADRTLYTTGLMPPSGGYPAVGDVRSGVSYGAGLYTGTCAIPAASNVSLGVPVDTTFGTAVLPITVATQMWAEPVTNLTVVGSIGERLKNCATTDTTGQQIAALM